MSARPLSEVSEGSSVEDEDRLIEGLDELDVPVKPKVREHFDHHQDSRLISAPPVCSARPMRSESATGRAPCLDVSRTLKTL